MITEKVLFYGARENKLPAMIWKPEGEIRAVLQVAHGMTEHIGRYTGLAQYLTEKGIAVTGFDLRGHGKNPGDPKCASFGENGWEASLEDMHRFYQLHREWFPGVPHFMLGFSLGSFLLREYLNRYDEPPKGAIIMGTGSQPGIVLSIIRAIVKTQINKVRFDQTTPLVNTLSFETYNKKFAPNRTPYDWLCADEQQLDLYRKDSLCREQISSGLFWELLGSMKRTGSSGAYKNWHRQMPVLLLSGETDPVGDFSKGVQKVKQTMEKAGITRVTTQFYKGRHDLLHEENSGTASKVREDIVIWIEKNLT